MDADPDADLELIREKVLYLDFNNKLPNDLLKNEIFVRLADLKDEHPVVQVNDMVFQGTYDYCVGTNLFFEKLPEPSAEDDFPFPEKAPFQFKLTECTTKILNLKEMKIPTSEHQLTIAETNAIQYNWSYEYKELLRQFENGTLDLNNLIKKPSFGEQPPPIRRIIPDQEETNTIQTENKINEPKLDIPSKEPPENENLMDISELSRLNMPESEDVSYDLKREYEKLELLARTPVRRSIPVEEAPCDPRFRKEYEYRSIECKILKPPLFSYHKKHPRKKPPIEDCIDIDRCITLGLLSPTNKTHPRILTEEEKVKIMTVENFENLDLTARYSVLSMLIEELELLISRNSPEENAVKDAFGRSPVETLEVFRRLAAALEKRIDEISRC